MRDTIKDMAYFNNFICEDLSRINRFSQKLESGDIKEERIVPVKSKVHDLKLGIMIARYSKGEELSLLEHDYLELVDDWNTVWEPQYYNKNLKMISLAVLFEIDKERIEKIKSMLKKSEINDWLLQYLLDSQETERKKNNNPLFFPNDISTLQEIVTGENRVALLKKYLLNEWYNENCGCYEAHKSKQNIYYGYWSFEAGAIAKILRLDDNSLKNVPYYPYELVHYKE